MSWVAGGTEEKRGLLEWKRMATEIDIKERIETSRKELLDLSLRNPLLNYRPLSARGVEIVGESVPQIVKTLVSDGRPMTFLPAKEDEADGTYILNWDESTHGFSANQSDRGLQTGESPSALHRRLLNTYRLANSAIEETGVNTLFLGLAMLRWYESDSSQEERLAPLVLVPVRLERIGVRERFSLRYTGDDLGINLSLIEKVREDFALSLPGQEVLEREDGQDIDPAGYIAHVGDTFNQSATSRWTVEPDRIVLGFFSFNKLLMYLDLGHPSVTHNEIITALFGDYGFSEPQSAIGDHEHLDERLSPSGVFHVLDADSSQALAIHDAARGRNMVIQGPPGTGKSQTIANIIAEAVAHDKRTLFVSEKMAALEVVKRRLDSIGLGGACLELHSHKTNKRETLNELDRTLNLPQRPATSVGGELLEQLFRTRSYLNEYAEAVNTPVGESGITPYDAFGELLALGHGKTVNPIHRREIPTISDWSSSDFQRKREIVDDLRLRLQSSGVPSLHPFWGSSLRVLLPDDRIGLEAKLDAALGCLETLTAASNDLADALHLRRPRDASAAADLLIAAQRALDAPDTSGLNLESPHWESNPGQIWDLVELGVQWQRMRWERIDAALRALEGLTDTSGALADVMRLDYPANTADAADLLAAATCARGAPDSDGLDLAAPQWESHAGQIHQLLTRGLEWRQMRSEYDQLLLPQAWDTDFQQVRLALNTDGRSFLKRLLSSRYKQAKRQVAAVLRGEMPRGIDRQIVLIDAISAEQQLRAEINQTYADAVPALGRLWNGHNTDWETVAPAIRWWLSVLADVAAGRVPASAVQRLQKLNVRLDADALQVRIAALSSAIDRYQVCARELKEVLDKDYRTAEGAPRRMESLPFDQQRRFMSHLPRQSSAENDAAAAPTGQVASMMRQSPAETATEINRLHRAVGPALGSRWNQLNTDWEAIAAAVLWWLDVLAEASAGRIPAGVVGILQSLTGRTVASRSPQEWQAQIEGLRRALEAHPGCVGELQSALDMDSQLRFGNPAGLTSVPFCEQRRMLCEWSANLSRIQDLVAFNAGSEAALEERLGPIVSVAMHNPSAATSLTGWFERAWYEDIVETAFSERPVLRNFDGLSHEGRIERFKSLDRQSLEYNRTRITSVHRKKASRPNQLPERLVRLDSGNDAAQIRERQQQLRILQREIQKRSRHKPIRQLLSEAGDVIQELKPVFMMSPLSIANYLAPDSVAFDLVVFDEASQVRPVDALGALLRAEKAVVVGDSRQLPPSSFFDRVVQLSEEAEDEDESITADIESILGLFASKGAPSSRLRWHYRSRHESLIAVSNQEFYDKQLGGIPQPRCRAGSLWLTLSSPTGRHI